MNVDIGTDPPELKPFAKKAVKAPTCAPKRSAERDFSAMWVLSGCDTGAFRRAGAGSWLGS
jgi:hypothetical protein